VARERGVELHAEAAVDVGAPAARGAGTVGLEDGRRVIGLAFAGVHDAQRAEAGNAPVRHVLGAGGAGDGKSGQRKKQELGEALSLHGSRRDRPTGRSSFSLAERPEFIQPARTAGTGRRKRRSRL